MKNAILIIVSAVFLATGCEGLPENAPTYGIRFDDQIPGDLQEANGFFDYITKNGKFTVILGFEPE